MKCKCSSEGTSTKFIEIKSNSANKCGFNLVFLAACMIKHCNAPSVEDCNELQFIQTCSTKKGLKHLVKKDEEWRGYSQRNDLSAQACSIWAYWCEWPLATRKKRAIESFKFLTEKRDSEMKG